LGKRGGLTVALFLFNIFYYLSNMEHLTKAEIYGKVLELQEENEQLRKQLNIQNGIYYG
jgi:hypothetical protein